MTRAILGIAAACAVGITAAHATEVTLPHTFTPNTPARAAEVNENFSAVKDAVDDNSQRVDALETEIDALGTEVAAHALTTHGGLKVKVNDVTLGSLVDLDPRFNVIALTAQGFFVDLTHTNASEAPGTDPLTKSALYFDQAGCQGNDYVEYVYGLPNGSLLVRQGVVFATSDSSGSTAIHYVKGEPELVSMASRRWFNSNTDVWDCNDLSFPDTNPKIVNAVMPNDPAVTGVPNDLSGPIRISID